MELISLALDDLTRYYGRLNVPQDTGEKIKSITLGHDLNGVRSGSHTFNPDGVMFLNIPAGEQLDGWGNRYQILLDTDGDGFVHPGGTPLPAPHAVWSNGPDELDQDGTGDDIASW